MKTHSKSVIKDCIAQVSMVYQEQEATAIVWILTEHFFGLNRLGLTLNPEMEFNNEQIQILQNAIQKVIQHTPVQYIIQKVDFLGFSLSVNESTLIPRPETEELTQLIINQIAEQTFRVLDIGTGSGCIALAIKKYCPQCTVYACDISEAALQTAKNNAKNNNLAVIFFQCDILNQQTWEKIPEVDIIISNPPYVLCSEKKKLAKNITMYEPEQAIFVADNAPLKFYEAIVALSNKKLLRKGKVFFEIHEKQSQNIVNILTSNMFTNIINIEDFRGKKRFIMGIQKKKDNDYPYGRLNS